MWLIFRVCSRTIPDSLQYRISSEKGFFEEKIICPSPALNKFEPWGQSGSRHICTLDHGPFVAFENGYVHIRGQYWYGKEVGTWKWFGPGGNVEKEIKYSDAVTGTASSN